MFDDPLADVQHSHGRRASMAREDANRGPQSIDEPLGARR